MRFMQKRLPQPVRPKLQSREDTATELNVHIRTVDKLLKSGKLKGVKVGRRHMVNRESSQALAAGE
jgi:excisionase family DNA binding protein